MNVSTVEAITDRLREDIRSGRLAPSQRLVEADLTVALGVSRGPLREAFRRLASEGLLELQHHRGAKVRQLSKAEIIALFQVREVLEGLSARLAAMAVQSGACDSAPLDDLVNAMNVALDDGRIGAYREKNQQFHDLIMAMSGNARLVEIARQLQVSVGRVQSATAIDLGTQRAGQAVHIEIAKAIAAGDADAADEAMRRHITDSLRIVTTDI